MVSVLHTWGSALTHHPHVHMIVPGGGNSLDATRWIECRPNFFLSVRVLSRLFRRRVLEKLASAHEAGQLQFFGQHAALTNAQSFAAHLAPLRQKEWVVYQTPVRGTGGSAALSRALHPGCHLQRRLVSIDDKGVTFKWKDYRLEGAERYNKMITHHTNRSSMNMAASFPSRRWYESILS